MSSFEKIPMGILDKVENNKQIFIAEFKDKLQEVFPSAVKDGIVDFEALLNEFGKYAETDEKEKYNMTWVGKKEAIKTANEDIIGKTLKYVQEDSKDPETTQNLYIEGDNLEVLKLLRNSYYGKIKMIYIDPPYNTGNDFIYKDNFKMDKEEYEKLEGSIDEYNERLTANKKGNGNYHSVWLDMMYSRLKIAKDLLKEDGVIFISIGEQEQHNLRIICDEIFGERNFIGCAGRISKKANNQGDYWAPNFDYLLTYTKNREFCIPFFGGINYDAYNQIEEHGSRKGEKYQLIRLYMTSLDPMRGCNNQRYFIECPDGSLVIPPGNNFPVDKKDGASIIPQNKQDKVWRWSQKSYLENKDKIVIKKVKSSNLVNEFGEKTYWNVYTKTYLNDVINKSTATPNNFIEDHINQLASHEIKKIGIPFDFSKPTSLIKYLCNICRVKNDDIILDFFSGSATTADATMQLNSEDNGNRKFIMVQLPELCNEKSEAYKNSYKNICEIGKERIRRAGEKIKEENKDKEGIENLDIGFKVFKVSDTNIRWISEAIKPNGGVEEKDIITQEELRENESYKDRLDFNPWFTDLDVIYELMLKRQDIELTERIDKLTHIGDRTYLVGYTILVCLEENITEEMVRKISEIETSLSWIVFRDSAFDDDINLKTNTINLLRTLIKEKNPRNKNQKILWI
ncbi:site-specific DNA-methyltransferase [Clostridium perfringens]|uniref:Type III restriction-modification system, Mod subunit n=1 Tax=Clostridium perfringens F262 TaxID=883064 RepID=A0AAV3FGE6_CLOPF|nr:site-specific DNA-methyltransferase [Clostridium perfringens]EIA18327.1 type III restriction-modification system, Mod subunit [Clostridium perfringens F262]